jgi:hypothetical protein
MQLRNSDGDPLPWDAQLREVIMGKGFSPCTNEKRGCRSIPPISPVKADVSSVASSGDSCRGHSFPAAAHVIPVAPPQDGGCLAGPAGGIDNNDGPAGLKFALIELGFMLRYACTHEGTDKSGDACPGRRIGEDNAQGSRRDGGTDDGNHARQHAEPGEGTQAQPGQGTGEGTRRGMRIVLRGRDVIDIFGMSHGDADLAPIEPGFVQLGDGSVGVETILEHAYDGGTLSSFHVKRFEQISVRKW